MLDNWVLRYNHLSVNDSTLSDSMDGASQKSDENDICLMDLCLIDMGKARLLEAYCQSIKQPSCSESSFPDAQDKLGLSMEDAKESTTGLVEMHMEALTLESSKQYLPNASSSVRLSYRGSTLPNNCSYKKELDCAEAGWRHEIDFLCVADCIHQLLYKQPLQIQRVHKPGSNATTKCHSYVRKPTNALRRYWNKELWGKVFQDLLNSGLEGKSDQDPASILWAMQDLLRQEIMRNKECALQVGG